MAVQAQYPSNVLLLNRNGQDGHDYSSSLLQQQQGGGFIDQSHMLFSNEGDNSRKRGREVAAAAAANAAGIVAPMNSSFSMQTQPAQFIDISQLRNYQQQQQQPNVVSTGLRLAFCGGGDHQQLQQNQNQQFQFHRQEEQRQQQSLVSQSSGGSVSLLPEDFAAQIKRQREELDQFLQSQGEQLRRTLAEKRRRHYGALLGAAEESVVRRIRDKQAEIEKATRRNSELEARAAQLSVEAQVWQAKARAHEAAAATLQTQLQQAIMSGVAAQDSRRGDGVLKCSGAGGAEDAESAYVDPERSAVAVAGPACKGCRKRAAAVVLLPCRHLCLCTECDRVAQACPLCLTVRNSSVEVFLN